jgi:hypothetical protein
MLLTGKSRSITLSFTVKRKLEYGRGLYLVGNLPEVGEWQPDLAVKLFWTEEDNWTQRLTFIIPTTGSILEYKFVEANFEQLDLREIVWDEGPNRVLKIEGTEEAPRPLSNSASASSCSSTNCGTNGTERTTTISKVDSKSPSPRKQHMTVKSLDCHQCNDQTLRNQLISIVETDFICLRGVNREVWQRLWSCLPSHFGYWDEDSLEELSIILYRAERWKLLKGGAGKEGLLWSSFLPLNSSKLFSIFISNKEDVQPKVLADSVISQDILCKAHYKTTYVSLGMAFPGRVRELPSLEPRKLRYKVSNSTNQQRVIKSVKANSPYLQQ